MGSVWSILIKKNTEKNQVLKTTSWIQSIDVSELRKNNRIQETDGNDSVHPLSSPVELAEQRRNKNTKIEKKNLPKTPVVWIQPILDPMLLVFSFPEEQGVVLSGSAWREVINET